jgi:hypothetical protein
LGAAAALWAFGGGDLGFGREEGRRRSADGRAPAAGGFIGGGRRAGWLVGLGGVRAVRGNGKGMTSWWVAGSGRQRSGTEEGKGGDVTAARHDPAGRAAIGACGAATSRGVRSRERGGDEVAEEEGGSARLGRP